MGYYIKICYLQKLNNNKSIGLKGSSSVEYSTQAERTEMTLKYCQNHKCHTYDTKDRKRGSKENRTNQTRRRSTFYYGNDNFCSMNCLNDWCNDFMDRAIDSVSGRLYEPKILTIENAWTKRKWWRYDDDYQNGHYTYFWKNTITNQEISITEDEYRNQQQPTL